MFIDILDRSSKAKPSTSRVALRFRLAIIRGRLWTLAKLLEGGVGTERTRELDAERRDLLCQRHEIEQILRPSKEAIADRERREQAEATRREPQRQLLQAAVNERAQQIETFARKLDREGEYRQAHIHRAQIPFVAEQVCRELDMPLDLIGEINVPDLSPASVAKP